MEHLNIRKPFIDYSLYTTYNGLVETDFESILNAIIKSNTQDEVINILCDTLPIDEILNLLPSAKTYSTNTNAPFLYYPIPLDMIKKDRIVVCYGTSTENSSFIHQIAFIYNSNIIRMGISW